MPKYKKTILSIISISLALISIFIMSACVKKVTPVEIPTIKITATDDYNVAEGSYKIPYSIANENELVDYNIQVSFTVTDHLNNKISVSNGFFEVKKDMSYNVIISVSGDKDIKTATKTIRVDAVRSGLIKTYTVDFSINGKVEKTERYQENQTANAPINPVVKGYRFIRWYTTNPNQAYDFLTPITDNITITALLEKIDYTVTFDVGEGTIANSQVITNIDKNFLVNEPTVTYYGYKVANWYTIDEYGEKIPYSFSTEILQDTTIYANYEPQVYTVNFDPNNGNDCFSQETNLKKEFFIQKPSDPQLADYVFMHWYITDSSTPFDFTQKITSDLTLNAHYVYLTYTVTFMSFGEEISNSSVNVTTDYKLSSLAPAQKSGYTFEHWYLSTDTTQSAYNIDTVINNDITLVAKFNIINYAVTFIHDNGEANTTAYTNVEGDYKLTPPATPIKEGYTFEYWHSIHTENIAFDFNTAIQENNVELKAKYKLNIYTVNFKIWDNTTKSYKIQSMTTNITIGYLVTPPTTERDGYQFSHYYEISDDEAGNPIDSSKPAVDFTTTQIKSNKRFQAQYNELRYTVVYYSNDGTRISTVANGCGITGIQNLPALPDLEENNEHYTKVGWEDSSGRAITEKTSITATMLEALDGVNVLKLKAKYKPVEYNITYRYTDSNDFVRNLSTIGKGTIEGLIGEHPTPPDRTGYNFIGWVDDNNQTVTNYTANTTLNASYTPKTFTVSYYKLPSDTIRASYSSGPYRSYIDTPFTQDEMTREGYTASGKWGYLDAAGNIIEVSFPYQITQDINLYVIWDIVNRDIIINVTLGNETKQFAVSTNIVLDYRMTILMIENAIISNQEIADFTINRSYRFVSLHDDSSLSDVSRRPLPMNIPSTEAPLVYYAKFQIVTVSISFYNELVGGSLLNSTTINYNTSPNTTQIPDVSAYDNKPGYNIKGWYYINNGSNVVIDNITNYRFKDSVTLYINYELVVHTLTLRIVLGTTYEDYAILETDITKNNLFVLPSQNPTRTGYRFRYWHEAGNESVSFNVNTYKITDVNVAQSEIIFAKFDLIEYTVSFKTLTDENINSITVDYTTDFKITNVPQPTRFGYEFKYWYTTTPGSQMDWNAKLTSNVTVTAYYEPIRYIITLMADDIELGTTYGSIEGIDSFPNTPTKDDYEFLGWFDENDTEYTASSQYNAAITLYAKYKTIDYTVTFITNKDNYTLSPYITNVELGYLVKEPVTYLDGSIFDGWFLNASFTNKFDFFSTISSNTTLYAKWRNITKNSVSSYEYETYTQKTYIGTQEGTRNRTRITALTETGLTTVDMLIPSTLNSNPVTQIKMGALAQSEALKTVTISHNIELINGTFASCKTLESVYITYTGGVLKLDSSTFVDCISLTNIFVPSSLYVQYMGDPVWSEYSHLISQISIEQNSLAEINGVVYLISDGVAIVKSVTARDQDTITIPQSIYGYPVVKILPLAFESSNASKIILPEGLIEIGSYAFSNALDLEELIIPSTVTYIGDSILRGCTSLSSITILSWTPMELSSKLFSFDSSSLAIYVPSVANYQSASVWREHASSYVEFTDNNSVYVYYNSNGGNPITPSVLNSSNSFIISTPPTPVRFGYNFVGWFDTSNFTTSTDFNSAIQTTKTVYARWEIDTTTIFKTETVIIKENNLFVEYIQIAGLSDYGNSLTTIEIPTEINGIKVRFILPGAFSTASKNTAFIIDANNEYFSINDGVLLSKNGTELISYPCAKTSVTYTIPTEVTKISAMAFKNSTGIQRITIGEKVSELGVSSFENTSIRYVDFDAKSTVMYIPYKCFENSMSLLEVTLNYTAMVIEERAFGNCTALHSVKFLSQNAPFITISTNAFYNCSVFERIYIPTLDLETAYSGVKQAIEEQANKTILVSASN